MVDCSGTTWNLGYVQAAHSTRNPYVRDTPRRDGDWAVSWFLHQGGYVIVSVSAKSAPQEAQLSMSEDRSATDAF